ncbi:MAG: MerR family transcriptional regulator [Ilumatobacteraceae bacterium]
MRVSGLSTATGVSVATLKYYLREGLLHGGAATAVNQAQYEESHVRRVKLIRALIVLGRLSIAEVREVLVAVDDESQSLHDAFGAAQDAMAPDASSDSEWLDAALASVDAFLARNDLYVRPESPLRTTLAETLVWLTEFGWGLPGIVVDAAVFDSLVPGLKEQAEFEISSVPPDADRTAQVEFTVVGTMVFEVAAAAIRRMALEDASAKRFGPVG